MENKGGFGLGTLLQVAFIVLKLCGVITWPWVLVLLPLEIGIVIAIIAAICVFVAIFKSRCATGSGGRKSSALFMEVCIC